MVRYNAIYRKQNRMIYLHELLFESTNSSLNRNVAILSQNLIYIHTLSHSICTNKDKNNTVIDFVLKAFRSESRACCIVAVTMYYEHIKYARRLDSSGWLLTAILASFQLCLFRYFDTSYCQQLWILMLVELYQFYYEWE
ncbi:hypothetical protein KSF78_0002754 [Schistosoma japonicum]|nr:hypothetical protein KSF78_0002754 [Schistosoma japonicum]